MLLRALYQYAQHRALIEEIELTSRTVHLALSVQADGEILPPSAWISLESPDPKDKDGQKTVPGERRLMPRFPGENNGGKAHFLADGCGPLLGIEAKSGVPVPDDPRVGKNATKAFRHFWRRIEDAHAATRLPELAALLAFRDRYLSDAATRGSLPFLAVVPVGKTAKPTPCALTGGGPIPLEGKVITFAFDDLPIFRPDSPLHEYWKEVYRREAFAGGGDTEGLGLCLVTGLDGQPIAGSHKPEIKGVPGLPPKGGYLVSFAREAPAFASYGFEGTRNAPVSEQAAAGYALALNDLLADRRFSRTINNDFVLCSWLREDPELSAEINGVVIYPTEDAVQKLFESYAQKGERYRALSSAHFYSMTLAANGGRVVVRRWLDVPLEEVIDHLRAWFDDLSLDVIAAPAPKSRGKSARAAAKTERPGTPPYRSVQGLALATVRTDEDVRPDVYDALHRAALEGTTPEGLLAPTLHRLRVAAVESGSEIRYHAPRFALLRLILNRIGRALPEEGRAMTIEPRLCVTDDGPYNCGRLLAVLDDIQYAAQGDVGADILARFYGNASTFPRNVLPRLLRLARVHINKLGSDKPGLAVSLERKLTEICALFSGDDPGSAAEFPGLLNVREQGRFALGFYQQKAADDRDRLARKAAAQAATPRQVDHDPDA